MKLRKRILFTAIVILAIIFSAVYTFLLFRGKTLVIKQLESFTQRKVSIDNFGIDVPLTIKMKNLNIEGLAKVDYISISPNIIGLLTGNIALDDVRIIKPELTYEKTTPKIVNPSVSVTSPAAITAVPSVGIVKPKKKRPLRLILKHINIKDGKINFIDHTISPAGIKITMKDINFNLTNLYVFPYSVVTNFELKGRIPWQAGKEEGKLETEGWLNLLKKDIKAILKIEDIDGVYLYPYYSNWVDLEKARIESAKLNFTSNIYGSNNNVTAECHLELMDIVRKPLQPEETEEKAAKITNAVLDVFKALDQGRIALDFTIRTKMDRPEFGFANVKMAFEDKLAQGRKAAGFNMQDVLMLPGNVLKGAVKGTTDLSKAVIDGTFSVAKELKKAVEDTFKKEKK